MKKEKEINRDTLTEEHCIDLPGESVRCWLSANSLKVVLRKHRDVIFDLKLGNGSYTVHATDSDFYCPRDKKLIMASRKEKVSFVDGERLHLWLTRGFRGSLILQNGDKLLLKVTPHELDPQRYDNDPKTKPAPIIISLGNTDKKLASIATPDNTKTQANQPVPKKTITPTPTMPPKPVTAPVDVDCPAVCVVAASKKGMPDKILQLFDFNSGGGKSGLVDIDPNDVATRNWIWGQLAGTAAYAADNWDWLKASIEGNFNRGFKFVKAKVHLVKGKVRFYFSGYTKLNKVFGPGGFGPGNAKIVNIFAGVGKTKSTFLAGAKGVAGSFKGFAAVSLIFGTATTYSEWKEDLSKDGYDLTAALIMSVLKTILVAAIVVAIVAFVAALVMLAAAAAMPVLLIGALSIGAGFIVNYGVEALDKRLGRFVSGEEKNDDGLSAILAPKLRHAAKEISASWNHLMEKFPKDYQWIEF